MPSKISKVLSLALSLSLSFGPSSVRAQQSEGAQGNESSSFFNRTLKNFKIPKTIALVGGQSAGGGQFLEAQIAQTLHDLVEAIQTKNPDNLDPRDFAELVEKTEIFLTSDKDQFKSEPACEPRREGVRDEPIAKNEFPKRLLIKLYLPYWEWAYRDGRDVAGLLYQEFRQFFFGNSCELQKSAPGRPLTPVFENMRDGDYRMEGKSGSSCLLHLRFNSVRKSVSLSWADNSLSGASCPSGSSPLVFQCLTNDLSHCVARRSDSGQRILSMQNPLQGDFGWKTRTDDQRLLAIEGGPFVRVDAELPQEEPKEFTVFSLFQNPRMNFSALCQKADEMARADADRLCRLRYHRNANSCTVIRSEVRRNPDFDGVDRCRIEATVSLSAPEQAK